MVSILRTPKTMSHEKIWYAINRAYHHGWFHAPRPAAASIIRDPKLDTWGMGELGYLRDDMIRSLQSFILIGRTLSSVAEQR